MSSSTTISVRDGYAAACSVDAQYSPAMEKAAAAGRPPLLVRRLRHMLATSKCRLLSGLGVLFIVVFVASRLTSLMAWSSHDHSSSMSSTSRAGGGYTVLINTWRRDSQLKQAVAHYALCSGTHAIRVVWSESGHPSEALKAHLSRIVSRNSRKPDLEFDINEEDNLNNRFKPIEGLSTDAVFSVDDDVIVPCRALDFAFIVWRSAPLTMVGFVPRMHWLDKEVASTVYQVTSMEGGGQFGGRGLIVWFSQKLLSFTKSIWICILITCTHQFKIMFPWREIVKI